MIKEFAISSILICLVSSAQAQEIAVTAAPNRDLHVGESSYGELYSETSFRPEFDSVVTQTRLRYLQPLPVTHVKAYGGFMLERDLKPEATARFIENSVRPHAGLLYQPFSFISAWAEYGQRFPESPLKESDKSQSDPRAGLAAGSFHEMRGWIFESYGEAVWIPRLDSGAVFSGYLRPFVRSKVTASIDADLYSELYGYSSPAAEYGPSRSQIRLGTRGTVRAFGLSASLMIYKPWALQNNETNPSQIEGLFVLGGIF